MQTVPAKTFPRLLRRLWSQSDANSRSMRVCDALGAPTPHQRVATHVGGYWLCGVTGQLQREEINSQPADQYDKYWSPHLAPTPETDAAIAICKQQLKTYEPYRKTGRLLEVASGQGDLLKAAMQLGWDATGNEISPLAADYAQKQSGAPILMGPIEQIDLEPQAYDVVLLNNLFEYLESPMIVMKQVTAALRPGGVIFIQTLVSQSLSLRSQGRDWYYFSPGHLCVPSHVSMNHYFQHTGLTVVTRTTHGYRSRPPHETRKRSYLERRWDKCLANIASLTHTGTRVRYLLQRNL